MLRLKPDFRLFLTNPPLNMGETPLQYHRPLAPMGLGYLAAMVEDAVTDSAWSGYVADRVRGRRSRGYPRSGCVAAADNMRDSFYGAYHLDALVERMDQFFAGVAPDRCVIGMSVLSDGMRSARKVLKRFRLHFPEATILVGGPHATFFPYDFYEHPDRKEGPLADFVVRNEGELAILAILNGDLDHASALARNGPSYGIQPERCDYTDPSYRVIDGGQFGQRSDGQAAFHVLDTLPPPAYFVFQAADGSLPYEPDRRYGLESPAANVNSSRGCPHHCTFCTIPKLAPGYRTLSPARMMEIVEFLAIEYGVRSLFFREDNFMYGGGSVGGDRWTDIGEFADRLRDAGLRLRWAIEARADNLLMDAGNGRRRLDVLADSGLTGIYVGVESGSDLMLKLYGKGATTAEMREAVRGCMDRDIAVVATACFSDPDLMARSRYPLIDPADPAYRREIVRQREEILGATRAMMDELRVPLERREEYTFVGIPISAQYQVLDREREQFPILVEHVDPETRYIFPKGFSWWSSRIYKSERRVRAYYGYDFPGETE